MQNQTRLHLPSAKADGGQVPNNWQETDLAGTATLNYGKGLPEVTRTVGAVPVYGSSGIAGYNNQALVNEQGYIIGRKGNVGSIYYSEVPFYPIDTVYYSTRSDIKCDFNFFYYLLKTLKLNKLNSDSAVPGLNRETAYVQRVLLPTVPEQKRIFSILSAFDDKIEINNKIAKNLEEMAQTIFKEWFVKFKFPGFEKTEFVDSDLGKIPENWRVGLVKDFGRVITGKTPSTRDSSNFGSDYPFITIPDMDNTFIIKTERYLSRKAAEKMNGMLLPQNSICVSCIATVGLVGITTKESLTNQQINSLVPTRDFYIYYLYQIFKSMKKDLELRGSGGTATLIINKSKFENIELVVPDNDTLLQFDKLVRPMYGKILKITEENQQLAALRDLLLPKLMKGEIRI